MDLISVWEATANEIKKRPALMGDEHSDVVIIGGGYTGLSTAYHLQKKGVKTIVLEQKKVGFGGSGRNGGQVLTGFIHKMSDLKKSKGLETARKMLKMSLDSIDLISDIIKENNISCDFHRNGQIIAAYKESHLDHLKKEQEVLKRDFDYEVTILDADEVPTELETRFYKGAYIDTNSAMFHPYNYALGLAEAVERNGGTIYEKTEALKIERNAQNKVIVTTDNGNVIADEIVIATNAYTTEKLHRTIARTIIPIDSIMIATEPLPQELVETLIKKNRAVEDSKNLLYYFKRTGDNRIVFGGSGRSANRRDENRLFDNLHAGMLRVFPQLQDARIEYRWGGKVGFTREFLPYIGQLEDGTYFAYGYAGHGASMSTLLGKVIAEKITRNQPEPNPLEVDELRPIPFHSQHARIVSLMKYYYKFLDSIS
ncbi:MAG: FAD-binding oxidoreductase [Bacillaceae bacterium]|nr:FAD-binding oxidoreductase [Bacillaceae bacterium]